MVDFPERDWKVFRDVAPLAADRWYKRILAEASSLLRGEGGAPEDNYERFTALYQLLREQKKELEGALDGFRRSAAYIQLVQLRARGLLTEEEFSRFSQETRDGVRKTIDIFKQ